MSPGPRWTPDTVFFIGNGVLRVAPTTSEGKKNILSPSWAEYMDELWRFANVDPDSPGYLEPDDFSRLPAPRQAEWFDREYRSTIDELDIPTLRLHLLGRALHPDNEILSNPLLQELARLIVSPLGDSSGRTDPIDVITTNLDCALEQNIAKAIDLLVASPARPEDERSEVGPTAGEAVIETIVDFQVSALWRRPIPGIPGRFRIRLWKIHGCLRDLKIRMQSAPSATAAVLELTGNAEIGLCAQVPLNRLARDLSDDWRQDHHTVTDERPYRGVFSQSEYFENLLVLAQMERPWLGANPIGPPDGDVGRLSDFHTLIANRPLIFVGYSLPEVDVDVMYALHKYRRTDPPPERWQLLELRSSSKTTEERLRQLGVSVWPFKVSSIGYAALPGKLGAAGRHEWRYKPDDPATEIPVAADWRKALQQTAAQAWLGPQLAALRSLATNSQTRSEDGSRGRRLVVAGLGSIWHGFALTKPADFPTPRRVSAQLVSVDAQVPGGSGLVPVMVAAAAAGPLAAGSVAFFSNVPKAWSSWNEIEDFCLSAGVAVYPWVPEQGAPQTDSVGRTSHIIFFDPARKDNRSLLPRQRFIMDVQSLTNERPDREEPADWSSIRVPPAVHVEDFQSKEEDDFLFVDKESEPRLIKEWRGPTVYETGASGIELVTKLRAAGVRPTMWTAGVGSFVRTMVELAGYTPDDAVYAGGAERVLEYLGEDSNLSQLIACGENRTYVAKVVSFGKDGIWDLNGIEGFTYENELNYGVWLRDKWHELKPAVSGLLRHVLAEPDKKIGGGVLATIHEGGLMALWGWQDRKLPESIVVEINTSADAANPGSLTITCAVSSSAKDLEQPDPITVHVTDNDLRIAVGPIEMPVKHTNPLRRNTLAAGDTVRGAFAYGLWAAAYGERSDRPVHIGRILLASAALATLKCYSGSFVDFLRILEDMRGTPLWHAMWDGSAAY